MTRQQLLLIKSMGQGISAWLRWVSLAQDFSWGHILGLEIEGSSGLWDEYLLSSYTWLSTGLIIFHCSYLSTELPRNMAHDFSQSERDTEEKASIMEAILILQTNLGSNILSFLSTLLLLLLLLLSCFSHVRLCVTP